MTRIVTLLIFCCGGIMSAFSTSPIPTPVPADAPAFHIVPQPLSVTPGSGSFTLGPGTVIVYHASNAEVRKSVEYLAGLLRQSTGLPLPIVDAATMPKRDYIFFNYIRDESLNREGYRLEATKDAVFLEANNDPGLFYAAQTLLQLLPPEVFASAKRSVAPWSVPCVTIVDTPRYTWRGAMLDVSRHFFPKEFVKRLIDHLAMHKINTFHWHLTDDQGWRIEIKKYPQLTKTSAWRADKEDVHWNVRTPQAPGEPATYGGFYTQDEIREVVRYAAEKYITVVPEIEMPSHATAVLTAFPEFSCTGGPFTVPPGGIWPIKDILCGGNDSVFVFLENVLREVADLFPGPFLHIGGDEADKTEWKRCPKCQARIRAEGLANEMELQSFFTRRIEGMLSRLGKRLIGWDEIMEGGLPARTAVMSWRGVAGGLEAARSGHDVVMTPTSHCYFDYYQGDPALEPIAIGAFIPLETVYSFEPTPDSLTPAEAKHILGVQANLWTEYIPQPANAEYMYFPRLSAIAEIGWTAKHLRSWPSFLDRMETQFKRYDARGINAARSIMAVSVRDSFDTSAWKRIVALSSQSGRGEIRYTLDGSTPSAGSQLYQEPFTITKSCVLAAATFMNGKAIGPTTTRRLSVTPFQDVRISLSSPPENTKADPSGKRLIDHRRATVAGVDTQWTGWKNSDVMMVLDLGRTTQVQRVIVGFYRSPGGLVFSPPTLEVSISDDGTTFTQVTRVQEASPVKDPRPTVRDYIAELNGVSARFIRLVATSPGAAPDWHRFPSDPTWIYADEIIVE
jgi:hexosaminidase